KLLIAINKACESLSRLSLIIVLIGPHTLAITVNNICHFWLIFIDLCIFLLERHFPLSHCLWPMFAIESCNTNPNNNDHEAIVKMYPLSHSRRFFSLISHMELFGLYKS